MENISKIKEQLPQGAQAEIAKRAGVHFSLVHRVLNGKSDNVEVLNSIADYLTEINEKKEAAVNRLQTLIGTNS